MYTKQVRKEHMSKQKSSEANIDNFIQQINPFKNLQLEREKSVGLSNFLPSFNEHKQQILSGKVKREKTQTKLSDMKH